MPVTCKIRSGKWRVIEADNGNIAKNKSGTAVDGGGHDSQSECLAQARAINRSIENNASMDDVFLYGIIGVDVTAASIKEELDQYVDDARTLRVRIHSEGGSYIEAAAIYNILASLPRTVVTYIEGACYSAASVVLMAGDEIQMCDNTLLMLHKPQYSAFLERLDSEYLKKQKENLDRVQGLIVDSIVKRTGRKSDEISNMLDNESWFTASEALSAKIIDKVVGHSTITVPIENHQIPDRIVAIFRPVSQDGGSLMALKDVVAQLHIPGVAENADDATLTNAIVNHFKSQRPALKRKKEKEPPKAPAAIVNLVKENRISKLNALVNHKDGAKITPAVKDELIALYCTDDRIVACLDKEFIPTDNFETVVAALEKNQAVVSFGGTSGKQTLQNNGSGTSDGKPKESSLVARMRKRAGIKN